MTPPAAAGWSDLGDGIRVRRSRVYAMNSVLLVEDDHALVVDPGVLPSELDDLAAAVRGHTSHEPTLFFTHGDWDHVLGLPWWPRARTVGHDGLAAELRAGREAILAEAEKTAAAAGETWERGFAPFRPDHTVSGLHVTRIGPWHLVFRDARGHSATMLSMHVPQLRLLVAGDMLSDVEIPILTAPADGFVRTLRDLAPLVEQGAVERLVPGHGTPAVGAEAATARVRADLGYLEALERDAAAAAAGGATRDDAVSAAVAHHPAAAAAGMDEVHRANAAIVFDARAGARRGTR